MATPSAPTTPLLLSRTLDPADYQQLQHELAIVGAQGVGAAAHPHRVLGYALALHAINRWSDANPTRPWLGPVYDVGGSERPFHRMVREGIGGLAVVVDPFSSDGQLTKLCTGGTPLADIVVCLSVIQRMPDQEAFLYHLSCLLAPGGLLVLTFDYWNRCGQDTARDHTLRQRIYCPRLYATLRQQAQSFQLTAFGGVDPTWHGAHVHDYSYASLVLEKRR